MTRYYLVGTQNGVAYPESNPAAVEHGRPVVVIDPEDREQVEQLWEAWRDNATNYMLAQDNLQATLREFANPTPPKPDEPTGLGAVVEDARGRKWVRAGHSYTDPNWRVSGGDEWTRYDEIAAVRVLSEGVPS